MDASKTRNAAFDCIEFSLLDGQTYWGNRNLEARYNDCQMQVWKEQLET